MSISNRELENAFERYFSNRVEKARAITPGQKEDLIEQLRRELKEEGRVPLTTGPVKVDPRHPAIRAALDGRAVTMGGKVLSKATDDSISGRMEALPLPAKIAVMAGMFLIPLIIVIFIMFGRGGGSQSEIVIQPTETATITVTPSPTGTPVPNATFTATPVPTQPPIIIEITPTPYAFALTEGDAPNSNNDPASIEIAGYSYILGTGKVENGAWQPTGAEWLKGSYLRKIIGLPYEPEIANVLAQIRAGNVIKLRLRSGEIVKYKIAQTLRVQRQQIEVLAERSPSLAIVLYGEPSPERTVVIALAVQEPQDFSVYSIAQNRDNPIVVEPQPPTDQPAPTPTLVPISQQTIITDTQIMTNQLARLTVEVKTCNKADDIGGQKPPKSKQKYMVCDLVLTADKDGLGTSYSQEALAITDQKEIDNSIDWKPPPVPQPSGGLGNGSLNAGDQVLGRIVGLVETDDPVLVWQQAGTKIIIQLE